jgi:hypothetical protein
VRYLTYLIPLQIWRITQSNGHSHISQSLPVTKQKAADLLVGWGDRENIRKREGMLEREREC